MRASIRPSKAERPPEKPAQDQPGLAPPPRRPGRKPRPRSDTEAVIQDLERQVSAERIRVSPKVRAWIAGFVADGQRDAVATATRLGLARPDRTRDWPAKYFNLLEVENLRATMGQQMELSEALWRLADLARTCEDSKVVHSALRTVLEVHGALSAKQLPPGDRKNVVRDLEEMVGRIKNLASVGGKGGLKVAATVSVTVEDTEKGEITSESPSQTVEIAPSTAVSISSEKAVDKGPEANIGVKTE